MLRYTKNHYNCFDRNEFVSSQTDTPYHGDSRPEMYRFVSIRPDTPTNRLFVFIIRGV